MSAEMKARSESKRSDKMALWMLLLVGIVTGAVFLWTSSQYQQSSGAVSTHVDDQGHLHVLGVTLGVSSLTQTEDILQSKSDVALYIYPEGHAKAGLKLEAFFPAIADHTKVVVLLDVEDSELQAIAMRGTVPRLYPNQVARMNLAPDDVTSVHDAIVKELTLIPNLNVTAENLKARFGEPDRIVSLGEGQDQYEYDAIGLKAVISKEEPPELHFSNPKM
ncbi:hypothetical protein [Mariprofundus sp. EBB-1]|uniref:hypothetical protein n=1 Tax=Mariprofundus sp. EBB-1 TaxID=2650971 RepID=UPI001F30DA97|nr:hypothetical protein [Mariprofundus sp. EBB-1]